MQERKDSHSEEIINAYRHMELLPSHLFVLLKNYSEQMNGEIARHNLTLSEIENEFRNKKNTIEIQKKNAYNEAIIAKQTILAQLQDLENHEMDSEAEYSNNIDFVPTSRIKVISTIRKKLTRVIQKIEGKEAKNKQECDIAYFRVTEQANRIFAEKIKNADKIHHAQLGAIIEEYNIALKGEYQRTKSCIELIYDSSKRVLLDLGLETQHSLHEILQVKIPAIENFIAAKNNPIAVEMGNLSLDFDEWKEIPHVEPMLELIREKFSYALQYVDGKSILQLPFGRGFEKANINMLIQHDNISRQQALDYIRAIEMRLFMSLPCGKFRATMIDPLDAGNNFFMFSCLGEVDEQIISTKIWSDSSCIKEKLNLLMGQIEHVFQDCLKNEFDNIIEYNKYVGKKSELLQALFVVDFPRHFDRESCEMLKKIVCYGYKCGIYTFIVGAEQDIKESSFNLNKILQSMEQMTYKEGKLQYQFGNMNQLVKPITLPSRQEQNKIFEIIKDGIKISENEPVSFDEISGGLTKKNEKWFMYSGENGIDIPIGQDASMKSVHLHLGGERVVQHHVLITGTIGSGKSTLLHTIIMSTLLRYSPETVQMYLLDFTGVEFKIYAESKLPNFRVVSLDTKPEYALAILQYLKQEKDERALMLRDKQCNNIDQYNKIAETALDDEIHKLPRLVVIIDEFCKIFSSSNYNVAKEGEFLLEEIVREGHVLGIHMVLASPILPDNLVRIYVRMANRIVFRSIPETTQYILDDSNEIINSLVNFKAGKAILNDGGGLRHANHSLRVAFFRDEERKELLERISSRQKEIYGWFEMEKTRLSRSCIQDKNENLLI